MSAEGIVFYLTRALGLALPAAALLFALRRCRRRGAPVCRRREAAVLAFYLYLFSLLSVTVIRDGKHLSDWWTLPHTLQTVHPVPIAVTLRQGRAGAWYLIYPIAGNLLWFLPFGMFRAYFRPGASVRQVFFGALLLSGSIELAQWVLLSGISDVDDVIFNVLGGVLGFALMRLWQNRHRR